MFGSKKPAQPEPAPFDNEGYERTHEYQVIACLGINAFNKQVNEMAMKGWELINGCMAGTAHYGYLRRPIKRPGE